MRVFWSRRSLRDLLAIKNYIAKNNPKNAANFVLVLFDSVESRLTQFPYSGRIIPELADSDYREIIHGNYRIMYKVEDDQVRIRTVRNSKQLFSQGEND